ncbi:MAG: hypothetical protein IJT34_03275 [Butyrivibrio sp.]|nr:hypothetical protein [Butyrivibrio sp.]
MELTNSLGLSQISALQAQNAAQKMVDNAAAAAERAQTGSSFAEALDAAAAGEEDAAATKAANNAKLDKDGDPINEELMGACKQFEAYFLEQVFEAMEKSTKVFSDDDGDRSTSTLVNFFKDQTLQTITNQAADTQSTGLAQMMYENMKHNLSGITGT